MPFIEVVDTAKGLSNLQHKVFCVSYEPFWQRIRMECKFKPVDECRASLTRLEAYIQMVDRTDEFERSLRSWRAFNLLNATPIGQTWGPGISKVPRVEAALITEGRKRYRGFLEEVGWPGFWDWAWTRKACTEMWATDDGERFLLSLYKHLKENRAYRGKKRELHYFLSILEETVA